MDHMEKKRGENKIIMEGISGSSIKNLHNHGS
jgi:hypothetical protein